jgi:hypothetical protein
MLDDGIVLQLFNVVTTFTFSVFVYPLHLVLLFNLYAIRSSLPRNCEDYFPGLVSYSLRDWMELKSFTIATHRLDKDDQEVLIRQPVSEIFL